jgi:hypothetical protein
MNKRFFSFSLIFFTVNYLFAADISLKGTVTSSDGKKIAGASITLKNVTNTSAVSDSMGLFSINTIVAVKPLPESSSSLSDLQIVLSGKNLQIFSPDHFDRGKIDLFSNNGARLMSISLNSRHTTVPLLQYGTGLLVLRITGENYSVLKTICCTNSALFFISENHLINRSTWVTFEKRSSAASIDTLIVSKDGYREKRVPLDSYINHSLNVILQSDQSSAVPPLVYDKEDTGEDCARLTLASDPTTHPSIATLPDPFLMVDGKTRISSFSEWRCRRAEIKQMIEKYETGEKPGKPDKLEASLSGTTITIKISVGSNSITMTSAISYPNGKPTTPVPAIIGINGATGSIQADIFRKRGIATITFTSNQIHSDGMFGGSATRTNGNFSKLYPQSRAGSMIRWAWGVSRLIDALETLPDAMIDVKHLAVSGCSYQGKIALYSGAFDERIALVLPHESGGTISWRYSDMLEDRDRTEVENLHHAQGCVWYGELLGKYIPTSVSPNTLPFDQHELIGMIAPRAVLCIESSKIARMGAEAARCSHLAARRIWQAMGIADRMGAIEENIDHCVWAPGYTKDVEAYVDKFLLGKNVNTDILRSKFTSVDEKKWIPWETPDLR